MSSTWQFSRCGWIRQCLAVLLYHQFADGALVYAEADVTKDTAPIVCSPSHHTLALHRKRIAQNFFIYITII